MNISYMLIPAVRTKESLNIDRIIKEVSKFNNVSLNEMESKSRKRHIVIARQQCMWFIKHFSLATLKYTAGIFGGRDHTTTVHSINTVNDLMETDPIYKVNMDVLMAKILNGITCLK